MLILFRLRSYICLMFYMAKAEAFYYFLRYAHARMVTSIGNYSFLFLILLLKENVLYDPNGCCARCFCHLVHVLLATFSP